MATPPRYALSRGFCAGPTTTNRPHVRTLLGPPPQNGGSVFVNTRYASSTFVSAGNTWAGGKAKCGSDIFLGRDVVSFNSASPATVVVSAQTNPPCRSLQVFAGVYNQSDYAKTASVCDTANPPFSVNHEAASVYACSAF